jgi:hypothetical protein
MVGSYLSRLLRNEGLSVDIYGVSNGHTACGIHPCAWGSSEGFHDHLRAVGLDPDDFVLMRPERVNFEGVDLPATLITFDKPSLIRELQDGSAVHLGPVDPSSYGRVIDATGVRRALLPRIENDVKIPCVQHRMRFDDRDSSVVSIKYGNVGYSWSFPLSKSEFHIGGGSLVLDPRQMVPESGLLGQGGEKICSCAGAVRATSPELSKPFVVHGKDGAPDVWGVGEAIGVVAPIAGEGIAPGMASARILNDSWDNPDAYAARILKDFRWMHSERKILDKVAGGKGLGIQDWITLKNTGRRMGAKVGIKDVMSLLGFLSKPEG